MKVSKELDLTRFEFWSGAKDFADNLTPSELQNIEQQLEELYPDGIDETTVNDLFWFEDEFLCELIGEDLEEVYNR